MALYLLSRLAAQSVKVVLAGEGGDELFAGYPKYAADPLAGLVSRLPASVPRALIHWLPYRQRRARIALEALSIHDRAERWATWFASFSRQERERLFAREFLAQINPAHSAQVVESYLEQQPGRTPLKRMLYADLKVWLPDNLLLRGDLMTMAASLEERVPFLDHKLVEFAARVPTKLLVRGLRAKALLKRAFEGLLPREILYRRKVGFTVPVGAWFRKPLKPFVSDLLLSPEALSRGYFNPVRVEKLLREHLDGARDRAKELWALVNFELWYRHAK